jgi:glutathione S-transferase
MIQLRYSPTSPYVGKVSVMMVETGLSGQIDRVLTKIRSVKCPS